MKLQSFSLFTKDAVNNMIRNRMMTVATIFILASGIFLFGITTALTINIFSITKTLEKDFKLAVYLDEELEQSDINKVGLKIQEIENVESTEFISKEAAFEDLKKQFGDTELLDGIDNGDILRNSYKITLTSLSHSSEVVKKLEKIKGIAKITKLEEEMEAFKDITTKAQIATVIMSIILALLSVLIITTTINMSIFNRRKQINIMKYVGATDWYIRWPFIIEGIFIGILASVFSSFITYFLYSSLISTMGKSVELLGVVPLNEAMPVVTFAIVSLGIILGYVGSMFSIKNHLKV